MVGSAQEVQSEQAASFTIQVIFGEQARRNVRKVIHVFMLTVHSLRYILTARLIPGLALLRKDAFTLRKKCGQDTARKMDGIVDLAIQLGVRSAFVKEWRSLCRPYGQDETGSDQKRWPKLRPVRAFGVAADLKRHGAFPAFQMDRRVYPERSPPEDNVGVLHTADTCE